MPARPDSSPDSPIGSGWYPVTHIVLDPEAVDMQRTGLREAIPCIEQTYHRDVGAAVEAWSAGSLRVETQGMRRGETSQADRDAALHGPHERAQWCLGAG